MIKNFNEIEVRKLISDSRIVHVITQFCFGGAENHVAQLAAAQVADGHKVSVVGLWPGLVGPERFVKNLQSSGVDCITIHSGWPLLRAQAIHKLGRELSRLKPDIVHSHMAAATIATGWWHRVHRKQSRCRAVTTIHGWEERQSIGWRRRILSYGLRHHDEIIAVSDWLANRSADFGLDPTVVHVVHHGIQQPAVDSASSKRIQLQIQEHFNSADIRIVGSIARQTEKKGLEVLIKALPLMSSGYRVVIVGAEGDATPKLQSLVAELGVSERCWFAGTTSDAADWMAAFDLFCLPSHLEGFGLVFLEAGLVGVPVVGSDVPAINEIVRTGQDGLLVTDGDSNLLSQAIEQILVDPAFAHGLVTSFRQRVQTKFSFKTMQDAIYRIYESKS